jgi:HEAT repeat protein
MSENRDIDALITELTNGSPDNPDAEWQAALALGAMTNPADRDRAVTALVNLLNSGAAHALTRSHAVEALGRLGDLAATGALVTALDDTYRLVRAYAAGALGQIGAPAAVIAALTVVLQNDAFYGVRAEAVAGLRAAALRAGDAATIQQVRDVLTQRRAVEVATAEPGVERVIAEIDRALAVLNVG